MDWIIPGGETDPHVDLPIIGLWTGNDADAPRHHQGSMRCDLEYGTCFVPLAAFDG